MTNTQLLTARQPSLHLRTVTPSRFTGQFWDHHSRTHKISEL
jgi:hypothetical protein